MRKCFLGAFFLLTVLLTVMLSGCSSDAVTVNGSRTEISAAGVGIEFPEDWKIYSGDDIYEITYSRNPDEFSSAEDLKNDIEGNGECYIVYAESPAEDALALFSSQPSDNSVNEAAYVGSLARTTHDSTVFEYRAGGYYTESAMTEENINGVSGWLSSIAVYDEQGGAVIAEQREFMFEKGKNIYSLRIFAQGGIIGQTGKISVFGL